MLESARRMIPSEVCLAVKCGKLLGTLYLQGEQAVVELSEGERISVAEFAVRAG